MVPDTLVVITQPATSSLDARNLIPAGVALVAAVIAGIAAWWGTRNQTQIAREGVAAQRAIADAGITAQREITEDAAKRHAEHARVDRVVQSRREWMGDIRRTVSDFERHAQLIHDWSVSNIGTKAEAHESRAEMLRLETYLGLLLDSHKAEHLSLKLAANAVSTWVMHSVKLAQPAAEDEPAFIASARKSPGYPQALGNLDTAAEFLLEQAWGKVKGGE